MPGFCSFQGPEGADDQNTHLDTGLIFNQIFMHQAVCCSYLTHRGYLRSGNEDSILVAGLVIANVSMERPEQMNIDRMPAIFCVADGIGGAAHGEIASRTVLDSISRTVPLPGCAEDISFMTGRAKEVLDGFVLHDPTYTGFGTTVAGLVLSPEQALIFNCGDSRVYRIDGGIIERLSHDHSLVQELCDQGVITAEQVYTHPYRNIITASISGDLHRQSPPVTVTLVRRSGTERFLLCTDGVWEVVRDTELASLCSTGTPESAAAGILSACLAGGGPDNISLILIGPC